MTPFESDVLRVLKLRAGPVSWQALREQFSVSAGYLGIVLRSLKRKLLVEHDAGCYRLTSLGGAALEPRARRAAFEGRGEW